MNLPSDWLVRIKKFMSIHGLSALKLSTKLQIDIKKFYQWIYDDEEPTFEEWIEFTKIEGRRIKAGHARPPENYNERICKFLDKHDLKFQELASILGCMPRIVQLWALGEARPQKRTWHRFIVVEDLPIKEVRRRLEQAYNPILTKMLNMGLTKTQIGDIIGCSVDMVRYKLCGSNQLSIEELNKAKEWLQSPDFGSGNPHTDPHPELPDNFNKRIIDFRKRWGITQETMGELLKLNPKTFWAVENGSRKLTEEQWNNFLAIEENGIAGARPLPPNPGGIIKRARKKLKISAPKLAIIVGWTSPSLIYKAEKGQQITPDTYYKIMEALDKVKNDNSNSKSR